MASYETQRFWPEAAVRGGLDASWLAAHPDVVVDVVRAGPNARVDAVLPPQLADVAVSLAVSAGRRRTLPGNISGLELAADLFAWPELGTSHVRALLAKFRCEDLRMRAALHPATPPSTLTVWAKRDPDLAAHVAKSPVTSSVTRRKLWKLTSDDAVLYTAWFGPLDAELWREHASPAAWRDVELAIETGSVQLLAALWPLICSHFPAEVYLPVAHRLVTAGSQHRSEVWSSCSVELDAALLDLLGPTPPERVPEPRGPLGGLLVSTPSVLARVDVKLFDIYASTPEFVKELAGVDQQQVCDEVVRLSDSPAGMWVRGCSTPMLLRVCSSSRWADRTVLTAIHTLAARNDTDPATLLDVAARHSVREDSGFRLAQLWERVAEAHKDPAVVLCAPARTVLHFSDPAVLDFVCEKLSTSGATTVFQEVCSDGFAGSFQEALDMLHVL